MFALFFCVHVDNEVDLQVFHSNVLVCNGILNTVEQAT